MLTRTITYEEVTTRHEVVVGGGGQRKRAVKVCEVQRDGASVTLVLVDGQRLPQRKDEPIDVRADDPKLDGAR